MWEYLENVSFREGKLCPQGLVLSAENASLQRGINKGV